MILNVTVNGTDAPFTLRYGSMESAELTNKFSASQFDRAITDIIAGSNIRVTQSTSSEQTIYQAVFFEAVLRNATLQVGSYNSSLVNVTITTIQMGRFPNNLILSLLTRNTDPIPLPSEQGVVEDQLHSLISATCSKTATSGQVFWSHTYDNSPGRVFGTLDNTIDPMCGRYSLKNPTEIFRASTSRNEITQEVVRDNIPWDAFRWVRMCNTYVLLIYYVYMFAHVYMCMDACMYLS